MPSPAIFLKRQPVPDIRQRMYLCLSSGLDTEQSLEMTARLIEHAGISKKIKTIQDNLTEGMLFAEALERADIFSGLYSHMVNIGLKPEL